MSSFDSNDDLSRSDLTLEMIARLQSASIQQNQPIEDDLTPDYLTVSPLEDIHDVSVTAGSADVDKEDTDDHIDEIPYMRRVAESPYPYDLIHTTVGPGFGFPDSGKKHAGGITCAGDTYIKIDHDPNGKTDMGDGSFGVAFWIRNPGIQSYGILCKKSVSALANIGLDIRISASQTITVTKSGTSGFVNIAGFESLFGVDLDDGDWHSVMINFEPTNMEIFFDNISVADVPHADVGNINNTRATYVCARDNGSTIFNKLAGDIAWLVWKKTEIFDATQRTDFHSNGLLDLRTTKDVEVITIPGMINDNPSPNASPSMCSAGT